MNIARYHTVRRIGVQEVVIKKSRFIGHSKPIESEEDAQIFIAEIKKKHWSATHHCYAYRIGGHVEIQKQSDDGEPSGTAGKPILEAMRQHDLTNVVIVVTRYFGGIMLGAGGLIRAYTQSAVAAITAGEIVMRVRHHQLFVQLDYTWLGKVESELRSRNFLLGNKVFSDKVTLTCLPLAEDAPSFKLWMIDFTQGEAIIVEGEYVYISN